MGHGGGGGIGRGGGVSGWRWRHGGGGGVRGRVSKEGGFKCNLALRRLRCAVCRATSAGSIFLFMGLSNRRTSGVPFGLSPADLKRAYAQAQKAQSAGGIRAHVILRSTLHGNRPAVGAVERMGHVARYGHTRGAVNLMQTCVNETPQLA